MTAAVELHGVEARYGSTVALRDVDLTVGADELLVVLGPTGAGKTTLLRVVAGLHDPSAGRVRLGGAPAAGQSPAARDVAFVFQDFSLYPGWTVRRNLAFPLQAPARREAAGVIAERVEWAAALLRVEPLLERRAETLSGGEMQRVAIGRAIVRRPRLFLLDEPLTNLDAKLREALRVELTVLRRELGVPMLYVTHDQAEALSMADRVAVLQAGRILQTGTPRQIYEAPASPAVARQLGQPAINLIPLRRADGGWRVEGSALAIDGLPDTDGATAWLGVRPEAIAVDGGPATAAATATVRLVEDTGPDLVLVVDWAGQTVHLLTGKGRRWRPGDTLQPRFDPRRCRLWPRADGGA